MVAGSYMAGQQEDSDKAVYYFTVCFLTGWFTFPIKLIKGFKKTYKEVERENKKNV